MGLDVSFERRAAIKAGLKIEISWDDITNDEEELVAIPDCDHYVANGAADGSDFIIVRANKWGRSYEPLTNWLTANGISWDEF